MLPSGSLPKIALGLAGLAVVLAGLATWVVASRGERARPAAVASAAATVITQKVKATSVVRLKHDAEVVRDHGVAGLRVQDARLRRDLGLERDDRITAISGRTIQTDFDVYDVLLGASMMAATVLYVDLVHDGAPVLVRWELDSDLRAARYADTDLAIADVGHGRDAFADAVITIDATSYKIPRATVDAILADPSFATSIRIVPVIRVGNPDGVKLFGITPSSVYAAVGLKDGDTLHAVNNRRLTTPDSALEAYLALKTADHLVIELDRRGSPVTISVTVTP